MPKFLYLSVVCILLFLMHQYVQKVLLISLPFVDSYLDDVLCVPIFLSVLLLERRFLLKNPNYTFSIFEIGVYVLVMGCVFEFGFPRWSAAFTQDYWDFLAYGVGGVLFYWSTLKSKISDCLWTTTE